MLKKKKLEYENKQVRNDFYWFNPKHRLTLPYLLIHLMSIWLFPLIIFQKPSHKNINPEKIIWLNSMGSYQDSYHILFD